MVCENKSIIDAARKIFVFKLTSRLVHTSTGGRIIEEPALSSSFPLFQHRRFRSLGHEMTEDAPTDLSLPSKAAYDYNDLAEF